jgi:hypothetical protein
MLKLSAEEFKEAPYIYSGETVRNKLTGETGTLQKKKDIGFVKLKNRRAVMISFQDKLTNTSWEAVRH